MTKKERPSIDVRTVPNGYTLTVDKGNYMYFTSEELLMGFMMHVGCGVTTELSKEKLPSIVAATVAYPTQEELVQRVAELERQIESLGRKPKTAIKKAKDDDDRVTDHPDDKKPATAAKKGRPSKKEPKPAQLSAEEISFRAQLYQKLSTPLEKLGLTAEALKVAQRIGDGGNKTLGDIIHYRVGEVTITRGCTDSVRKELRKMAKDYGLMFGYKLPKWAKK
ncbi:MAG: hypothetical protein IKD75_07050 [Prevotella sp.]|nr:hypothetical protein [Prevotella sp.]